MTLKEFVDRARREGGTLEVKFVKVTDKTERTAIYAANAEAGYSLQESKVVSPKTLKNITDTFDRVYVQNVQYVGAYFVFPERVSEHSTQHTVNPRYLKPLPDGGQWQWRSLYVQQMISVKYNGQVVWENNDLFNFSLIGEDGEIRTVMPRAEYDAMIKQQEEERNAEARDEAERIARHKKAVALARTLSDQDCAVDTGYVNGHAYDSEDESIRYDAINIKHDWLVRTHPERHQMSYIDTNRGYHERSCTCGYVWRMDSSD